MKNRKTKLFFGAFAALAIIAFIAVLINPGEVPILRSQTDMKGYYNEDLFGYFTNKADVIDELSKYEQGDVFCLGVKKTHTGIGAIMFTYTFFPEEKYDSLKTTTAKSSIKYDKVKVVRKNW